MRNSSFSPDSVVVGHSPRMRGVFDFVRVIADSQSNVLITGESGTGKEVIANLIHHSSPRRHQPFVAVSCALFSENLIETELFGHERGAFTGAIKDKPGRFELAQGGTIFLDDIDDVPLAMQVKLLRVIQNRVIERVGGTRATPVNVRVITGSKKDLKQLVSEGKFREDLYYRLNVLPINLPPLRERREDIPALIDHFFKRFFRQRGEAAPDISPMVKNIFTRYDWPGNVRELENACERMAQTCTCGTIRVGCMGAQVLFQVGPDALQEAPLNDADGLPAGISLDDRLREVETSLINWALKVSKSNKSRAAELLNIKRSTLGDRIARCGLQVSDEAPAAEAASDSPLAAAM
ncbi:MAG: sigma-54-dependent Fis family transcriptional regulator [Acidobacteria bacterium]|nr:sigma-54-dependent Fis family transcriptional regulator [Acidobacteriota bacterium]